MARKKLSLAGKYAVSLILVLMVFLPLLVTIISSLKIPGSLDAQSPLWISSSDMTLNNYLSVFKERYLVRAFTNTIKIVAVSIFFNVLVGSITAYCLERFEFRFKKIIYILFYLAMMVPTKDRGAAGYRQEYRRGQRKKRSFRLAQAVQISGYPPCFLLIMASRSWLLIICEPCKYRQCDQPRHF